MATMALEISHATPAPTSPYSGVRTRVSPMRRMKLHRSASSSDRPLPRERETYWKMRMKVRKMTVSPKRRSSGVPSCT
jgi:hypothetical protein